MKEARQREGLARHNAINLLWRVKIREHLVTKGVLHLGKSQEISDFRCRDLRPTIVEFADARHRDKFMEFVDRIKAITRGEITMQTYDTVISEIEAKTAIGRSPRILATWPQYPNCEFISWVKKGN